VSRWAARVSLLLVVLGVAVRVRQWLGGRSLWLDEALVAGSLVDRGHLQLLTEPLLHRQAAPQAWLQASRLAVELFGDDERALRLVPLLSGCAALVVLARLAPRLLPPALAPVAVGLCALHPGLVYYSNELKPYATDVLVVLVVLLVALRDRPLLLGLTGAVAVWCAYPAVFALAAASLVLVLRRGTLHERGKAALRLAPWPVSLAVAYVLVLRPVRQEAVVAAYWAFAFPRSASDLPAWLVRQGLDLARTPLRLAVPLLALALLVLGVGVLWRRAPTAALLVLGAVGPAVVAAALSVYPLADRLALWTVPPVALLLAAAVAAPPTRPLVLPVALALLVTAGPAVADGLRLAVRVQHVEELRPVLERVAAQRRPGDLVLVDVAAVAAFDHYGPRLGVPRDGVVLFATPPPGRGCDGDVVALRTGRFGEGRVWLVRSHELSEARALGSRADLLGRVGTVTRLVRRLSAPGAEALLLSPRRGGRELPTAPATPRRCLVVNRSGG
jgi:Dolichyl-phosphate-mannose-protein mannosyltransferase